MKKSPATCDFVYLRENCVGEVRIRPFSEEYMEITDKRDAYMGFEYIKATLQRLYE